MSMSGDDAYVLAMDYVDEALEVGGALKGDDGKSAYQSWLDLGNTGTEEDFINSLKGENGKDGANGADGQPGEKGDNGKSAYQYAKDGGYIGTETEFTTNIARSGVISKELEVERARIDNLTTLKDGSTTGDAELIDSRIDKDGNAHVNVGEHIRTVSSQLSSDITDVKSDLIQNHATSFKEEGKYICYVDGNSSAFKSTNYVEVNVEGAKYINYYYTVTPTPDMCGLAFYDASGRFLSGVQTLTNKQLFIDVPQGATICRATVKMVNQLAVVTDIDSVLATQVKVDAYADFLKVEEVTLQLNLGYYVNDSGNLNALEQTVYSEPIPLKRNQKITFRGCGSKRVVALISTSNDGETLPYTVRVLDNSSGKVETVSYTATENCYAIVSALNDMVCKAWVYYDVEAIVTELNNTIITHPKQLTEQRKYVSYKNGAIYALSGLNYVTAYVKGAEYINYNYTAPYDDERGLAFYDEDGNYISGIQTKSYPQKSIPIPNNAVLCKATVKISDQLAVIASVDYILRSVQNAKDVIEKGYDILSAFANITCIGDSLTYSQVYTGSNSSRQAYKPYPTILGNRVGASTLNLAEGGATPIYCWEHYANQIVSKTAQLFIIYLGTNYGMTDTLSTDAPTSVPYEEWSDTSTGCYAKLIAKAQAVGGKVLLIKCWASSGDLDTTNYVIDQCASRFGCAVVEPMVLTDAKYHYYPDLSGQNGVHYNDLGYSAFVDLLIQRVGLLETDVMKFIIPN